MSEKKMVAGAVPGTGGDKYIPMEKRTGNESIVYFTRDLSPKGLQKAYEKVNANISGKVAIKLHTGEKDGPNIIPRPWVKALIEKEDELKEAAIVDPNTFYPGDRDSTEKHRETIAHNGWTFCPVDIMDEDGAALLPVKGAKWIPEISVGKNMLNYDSMFVLTHFKGHVMGGFGGSNKNIGIGCADAMGGKAQIHTKTGKFNHWDIAMEELMERMAESSKGTVDHFGKNITFVNVLRNMSVSCDCEGVAAAPVVTPNIGILASTDILAIDQASVDLVFALSDADHKDLVERMTTRHGLRQLSYMKELGMGNDRYILIDLDNEEIRISPSDAVRDVKPFTAS